MIMISNDATWVRVDEDGKATVSITDPEFLDALQLWQDLKSVHGVTSDMGGRELFQAGNLAMLFGDMNALSRALNSDVVQDWVWVYFPKGPNAEDYVAYAHIFYLASLDIMWRIQKPW